MSAIVFCNKCGAQNTSEAQFCSRCGAPLNPVTATAPSPASPAPGATAYSTPAPLYAPVSPGVGYGGFWIRFVAFIIDAIVMRIVIAPFALIFGVLGFAGGAIHGFPHIGFGLLGGGVTVILLAVGSWLYEALLESSSYQATLGKMLFGMKVTDLNGNRISFARATVRHFAKWLSGIILLIGYIMVGFTLRKQGLHDLIAETLVIRGR